MPVLKFKECTLSNIIATKATFSTFCFFESCLFVEKSEEHKRLSKLDGSLLQSINLCLVNILPKVFEVWRFLYISFTFGNTLELLRLYVSSMQVGDIAKISNKKNAQKVKQEKLAIFTKILIHTFHALCFHYTYCL